MMESISEVPTITYRPFHNLPDDLNLDNIIELHRVRLKEALPREREQRRSLVGPHRDELIFRLNEIEVRRYASQGQHRTFGMALKLAKFLYLKEILDEAPLLLLDDVFGDLDRHRAGVFLKLLEESSQLGQSIITTADDAAFHETIDFGKRVHSHQTIVEGHVAEGTD